jgi:hypothetical protein
MKSSVIKCVCAAINSNGEPDFFFFRIRCTEEQCDAGDHYVAAEAEVSKQGGESSLCFDERDSAFSAFRPNAFVWRSAEVVDISQRVPDLIG